MWRTPAAAPDVVGRGDLADNREHGGGARLLLLLLAHLSEGKHKTQGGLVGLTLAVNPQKGGSMKEGGLVELTLQCFLRVYPN